MRADAHPAALADPASIDKPATLARVTDHVKARFRPLVTYLVLPRPLNQTGVDAEARLHWHGHAPALQVVERYGQGRVLLTAEFGPLRLVTEAEDEVPEPLQSLVDDERMVFLSLCDVLRSEPGLAPYAGLADLIESAINGR